MKKMAVCITAYEPGGQSVVLEELSKRFAEFFEVDLYCVYSKKNKPGWIKNIYHINPWKNKYLPIINNEFIKKIKKGNYDIIHCHDSLPFMDALYGDDISYFVTCHGNCDWKFRSGIISKIDGIASLYFYKKAYRKAKGVVAISEYVKNWLGDRYSVESEIIYNGVSLERFYPSSASKTGNRQELVYFGQISHRKGIFDLLDAIKELKKKYPDILLNLGGFGEDTFIKKVKKFILENNLENNIKILGFVSSEKQLYYYNRCDAVITASFWEGFGLPIVEAYSCNKPIFVRNNTAMKELVRDGRFRFDCVHELVEKLDYFFSHKDKFSANYTENLDLKIFNWDYSSNQYLALFENNERK